MGGINLVPGGGVPGLGGCVPGPWGVSGLGGVPGPGGVYLVHGVYLVPGVYLVWGVYLVPGGTCSEGAPGLGGYLVGGVYLVRYSPPVDRHTPVKT